VTGKSLNLQEWDQIDWEKDWKSIVDLISLYRQLAELFLQQADNENDSKAYYTLLQLGNCFQPLELGALELNEEGLWKPKTNQLLKATRAFEKIMEMLVPNFGTSNKMEVEAEEQEEKAEEKDNKHVENEYSL